jgi:glycosyltransferase involved in cell wall biosynthesis
LACRGLESGALTTIESLETSVVIPLLNEQAAVRPLLERLVPVLEGLGGGWEVILVDDGSTDGTWSVICEAALDDRRIRGLRLSRRFGHQAAITAGLSAAEGTGVVTMDGDLQHPPEAIPALVAKGSEGFDIVHAIRGDDDSAGLLKRVPADLFYFLLNRLTSLTLPPGAGDFRYISRRACDALLAMPERNRFVRGLSRWIGYSQTCITYERQERVAGTTKYSLRQMVAFAWDAVVGFSSLPLRVASLFGFAVSFLGFLYLVYILVIRFFTDRAVAGWTSVTAAVLLLGGVQLICLGILGQYLGRMFDEIKGRPLFLVWEDTRKTLQSPAARRRTDLVGAPRSVKD